MPTHTYRLGRILRSAQAAHDDAVLQRVADRLDPGMDEIARQLPRALDGVTLSQAWGGESSGR